MPWGSAVKDCKKAGNQNYAQKGDFQRQPEGGVEEPRAGPLGKCGEVTGLILSGYHARLR